MTISATTNRITYTGNGATTAFAFAYPFHAEADLVVIETIIATGAQTTKSLTTHYTISGTTDAQGHYPNGGTVNAVTAPASTVTWTIYRDPSPVQNTDFVQNDDLPAESLESAIDYQTLLNQRTRDLITRSLRQPEGDSANIDYLPAKVTRASKYLAFDADGDPVASSGTTSSAVISTFMETVLDDTTAEAARATLGAAADTAVLATVVDAKGDLLVATAADTVARKAAGSNGASLRCDSAQSDGHSYGALAGYLWGLTLSNNGSDATNDIDIAVGEASSSSTTYSSRAVLALTSALTKRLDATWAVGTNQGGRSSSQALANGTWHVFLIRVAGTDDIGFDTSATGANLITDHSATHVRRIGSILRESAAIVAFSQNDDEFLRATSVLDYSSGANPGTAAISVTLSVPAGVVVTAKTKVVTASTTNNYILVSSLAQSDQAPSGSAAPLADQTQGNTGFATFPMNREVQTNTSRQIRYRLTNSDASVSVLIATYGWVDSRGRVN